MLLAVVYKCDFESPPPSQYRKRLNIDFEVFTYYFVGKPDICYDN